MKVCPKCGHKDSMIWKPLFWKLYWEYADLRDFIKEGHPAIKHIESYNIMQVYREKKKCDLGNFTYNFEDELYYYKFSGKTRKMIHRFPKGWEELGNKKLYEKTPSEQGQDDIFQRKLLGVVE